MPQPYPRSRREGTAHYETTGEKEQRNVALTTRPAHGRTSRVRSHTPESYERYKRHERERHRHEALHLQPSSSVEAAARAPPQPPRRGCLQQP